MKDLAGQPWKIQELPGRNPSTQWPESLDDLVSRLSKLEPMSAWSEPLFDTDGKSFYEQAEDFIIKIVERKKKLIQEKATAEKLAKIDATLGAAISVLLGLSVLSADYTRILSSLYVIYEISENYPDSDSLIS